jgi:hypothetical protein
MGNYTTSPPLEGCPKGGVVDFEITNSIKIQSMINIIEFPRLGIYFWSIKFKV